MHVRGSIVSRIVALAAVAVLICTDTAPAQTFENRYGSNSCNEAGHSGIPVQSGGYIAVGESFSNNGNCSQSDIYVVRTYNDGSLFWSMSYDFGGHDSALSVKEIFNDPTENGGFIITGVTEHQFSNCTPNRDIFLLRIDSCGTVLWAQTYGSPSSDEIGWDVLEATTGNPVYGTSIGDIVVAGSTTINDPSLRDGYLLRVEGSQGNIVWDGVYNGPAELDDYFYSLDEALFYRPSITGDIVAAGGSNSYGAGYQGWIVRVSGNDGTFWGGLHNSAAYGGDSLEEFHSIRELGVSNMYHLVATGTAVILPDFEDRFVVKDVYVVETEPDPCTKVADVVFGTYDGNPSEGYAIREINFNGNYYNQGYLIVTGYMYNLNLGKQENVFLQVVEPGSLALTGPATCYWNDDNDRGRSVEPLRSNPDCLSQGFVVTGFTQGSNPISSLYLIKTDEDLVANCRDLQQNLASEHPDWGAICERLDVGNILEQCEAVPEWQCRNWRIPICYDPLWTIFCAPDTCEVCQEQGTKRLTHSSEALHNGITSLSGFPNPVKSGGPITLEYRLLKDARVTISVSDLAGRILHNKIFNGTSGAGTASIGTEGWAAGSYMISLSVDGKAATTRIIVTE